MQFLHPRTGDRLKGLDKSNYAIPYRMLLPDKNNNPKTFSWQLFERLVNHQSGVKNGGGI